MESSSQPEQQPSDEPQQGRVYPTEKQNKETFKVLLHAVQRGTPSNMLAVDRFFRDCKTKEDVRRADALLRAYEPIWAKIRENTGSYFIQACLRAGDLERAMRVMRDHRKMRLVLTKTTATWALKEIGKDKRVQDFAGTLHVVRKLVPGTATCDKTLEIAQRAYLEMGEIAKAAQLMKDFMELGTKPSPLNIKLLLMNAKNAITSGGDLAKEGKIAQDLVRDLAAKDPDCAELLAEDCSGAAADDGGQAEVAEESSGAEGTK